MPPRHRFLEPIHNVKEGQQPHASAAWAAKIWSSYLEIWWSQPGSNRRPQACKASALPTELWPHPKVTKVTRIEGENPLSSVKPNLRRAALLMVGRVGVEPTTSRLSGVRSNHLSYRPPMPPERPKGRRRREPAQAYASRGRRFPG